MPFRTASFTLMLTLCTCISAYADSKIGQPVAPWDIRNEVLEPKLLTVDDIEKSISPAKKSHLPPKQNDSANKSRSEKTILSPLEKLYSARAKETLRQFGYANFSSVKKDQDTPVGAVQDTHILSVGDELVVHIRGQQESDENSQINSEGLLVVKGLTPVSAAGRTLGDIREQIREEVKRLYNTDAYLSLARVNRIDVLVAGHVQNPGRQALTSFDTLFDALIASGGVDKTGSLRQIRLIRGGKTTFVDLYTFLIFGSGGADITLQNGDQILVPPIGPVVGITGGVKRPGIYEILPMPKTLFRRIATAQSLSTEDMLKFAGGLLSPSNERYLKISPDGKNRETVTLVTDAMAALFTDGDILSVPQSTLRQNNAVELAGNVSQPGIYPLSDAKTLAALLDDEAVFKTDTYPLMGIVERTAKNKMTKKLLAFSPAQVLSGREFRPLENGDKIHLFTQVQIEKIKQTDPQDEMRAAGDAEDEAKSGNNDSISLPMKKFLYEHSVFLRGSVQNPGAYPLSGSVDIDTLVDVGGGMTLEGSRANIELTRSGMRQQRETIDIDEISDRQVRAGDTVRINQKQRRIEDRHILLIGEIQNPGTYDIQPGDTLSTLIRRSGGLTAEAYPDGTIFSREGERKREEARFRAQAQDLELRLAATIQEENEKKKPSPENLAVARDLIVQLKQASGLGRITVQSDPAVLSRDPAQDLLLESGDRIYIPKRPMNVRVAGEVQSPAALQFRSGKTPREYISEAGGPSYNADEDRAFVVYPDGSARPLAVSAWRHGDPFIPPGSTIIVPRDPDPYSFIEGAKDVSQILANVATAAIFADAIRDND